jgi:hypothetical protein
MEGKNAEKKTHIGSEGKNTEKKTHTGSENLSISLDKMQKNIKKRMETRPQRS